MVLSRLCMESDIPYEHFVQVTEIAGDDVTQEQVRRLCSKYYWAEPLCRGKDVLEVGCGTGPGLGYLARSARSVVGGDISEPILSKARAHYGDRIDLRRMNAEALPFVDGSKDVLLLFEAIYYLPSAETFVREARRVLRPGGRLLIVTANKDLYAFNPSPHSHTYYGVVELNQLLEDQGFECSFYGDTSVASVPTRQKFLQPIKQLAVRFHLIPKTMSGKKLLKKLVFGKTVPMPPEISAHTAVCDEPTPLVSSQPSREYKVIYCEARLKAAH